jgi:predicted phosphoadenosine phosphosulfate sulfurtransferase
LARAWPRSLRRFYRWCGSEKYIEADVLTEAKKRLHHIFDLFDSVVVMFSGRKDSLATLHLTREVMVERGITKPLDVVFRDEELIPDEVIDFVDKYRRADWIKMIWFTVPLASTKFMLGTCVIVMGPWAPMGATETEMWCQFAGRRWWFLYETTASC